MTIQCVLFDLDGTLVDTAPDLHFALNQLLIEQGREPLDQASTRPYASAGARGLLRLGFGLTEKDEKYPALRQRFLDIYAANINRQSRLFDGMADSLKELYQRDIAWGVVTNKPGWLTEPLMDSLALPHPPVCIIAGDATPQPKPDPANLLLACAQCGYSVDDCIYVGDAQRDILAGQRAGMRTVAVSYGYIENGHAPGDWGADWLIDHPSELLNCLLP